MRANPRVALLVYDPRNPLHHIEVRGLVVEMTEVGAVEHDDDLARLYLGKLDAHFFGDVVPAQLAATYYPVKVTIAPTRVRVEEPDTMVSPRKVPSEYVSQRQGSNRTPVSMCLSRPGNLPLAIPGSHQDLLLRPIYGVLSTVMLEWSEAQPQPQDSLVWVDYDGTHVLINTTLERQECRNIQANPKVTLLVVDPENIERWIEVRGRVAKITSEGTIAHADKPTQPCSGNEHFHGDVYEVEQQQYETRVTVEVEPEKVSLDTIFRWRESWNPMCKTTGE